MGEKVLFVMPLEYNNRIGTGKFCGHRWRNDEINEMDAHVKGTLDKFYQNAHPESFGEFLFALWEHALISRNRIWIIVDEIVLFEKFPIHLQRIKVLAHLIGLLLVVLELGRGLPRCILRSLYLICLFLPRKNALNLQTISAIRWESI